MLLHYGNSFLNKAETTCNSSSISASGRVNNCFLSGGFSPGINFINFIKKGIINRIIIVIQYLKCCFAIIYLPKSICFKLINYEDKQKDKN